MLGSADQQGDAADSNRSDAAPAVLLRNGAHTIDVHGVLQRHHVPVERSVNAVDVSDPDLLSGQHHTGAVPDNIQDEPDVSVHHLHENDSDRGTGAESGELSRMHHLSGSCDHHWKICIQEERR